MENARVYDVAIIGGGVSGAACAFELSKYEVSVAVLEAGNDVSLGTSKANSAIIHAGYDPAPGTLMAKLNVEGSEMMEGLCRYLDVPYQRTGSLVLAFSDEGDSKVKSLYERGVKNGVRDLEIVSGGRVAEMEPNVSQAVTSALYAPTAAIISPWELTLALAECAAQNGADILLRSRVCSIVKKASPEIFELKTENGGKIHARRIINAAGVHSDDIARMVGDESFSVTPSRGQYYLLDKSEGGTVSRVIFQTPTKLGKGVLVSPTVHGNLIVGPDAVFTGEKDNVSVTAQGLENIAKMAKMSVPALNLRASIRNFAGVRAETDSIDFVIGESAACRGFFNLAGMRSPGLSSAPAAGAYMARLIEESGITLVPKTELAPVRKKVRFARLSDIERAELVRRDPLYGTIVCRCETVTEGEIRDALLSPIPPVSVDGVKRRCGAGMGRCQGGFCSPKVVKILAEHYKVPMSAVFQDDDGSYILAGETKGGLCRE